ncbi:hypothetical protein RCG63_02715 [Lactococcus lactis]|uniref:Uncharacterized protein n=1 Tax=Lactococcus lactis TaxID=1358 RepID=A0ABD5GNF9_9LACT|nr:hypothetical protein [Lactococcus lactis]MDQ7158907.1 hypothetical protein [Lactococcus lactis]MDV2618167.1 hypothetical protein [Lactococcus lactis]
METKELTWDYDFKKILLGDTAYDSNKNEVIKNILLAKDFSNYVDSKSDYNKFYQGHIENYQVIEIIFKEVFQKVNGSHKDVMNSFWTTYKFFLQIEYPDIFTPVGSLRNKNPLKKNINLIVSKVSNAYPPFDSKKHQIIHQKYICYYKKYFPQLNVKEGDTWNQFLMENFNQFDKVHLCLELVQFAKLTHSIGNIAVVPKDFNASRYLPYLDYWDLSLNSLKKCMPAYNSWDSFVDSHYLNNYVDEHYNVLPFWENHFKRTNPTTREEIIMFLTKANFCIENRGKKILSQIRKKNNDESI